MTHCAANGGSPAGDGAFTAAAKEEVRYRLDCDGRLQHLDRRVCGLMIYYANDDRLAWPSTRTLAAAIGADRRHVQRSLRANPPQPRDAPIYSQTPRSLRPTKSR